jgi:hypothetical protein
MEHSTFRINFEDVQHLENNFEEINVGKFVASESHQQTRF